VSRCSLKVNSVLPSPGPTVVNPSGVTKTKQNKESL